MCEAPQTPILKKRTQILLKLTEELREVLEFKFMGGGNPQVRVLRSNG